MSISLCKGSTGGIEMLRKCSKVTHRTLTRPWASSGKGQGGCIEDTTRGTIGKMILFKLLQQGQRPGSPDHSVWARQTHLDFHRAVQTG